jgi:dipeptidyl aminopeptidase/acylaminoacyl peptidase
MRTVKSEQLLRRSMEKLAIILLLLSSLAHPTSGDDLQPQPITRSAANRSPSFDETEAAGNLGFVGGNPADSNAIDSPVESPQSTARRDEGGRRVFKDRIAPHWFHENTRFWYRNIFRGDTKEFILVDAARGARGPAFDHARLAAGLSKAASAEYRADRLPFESIYFIDDDKAIRFNVGNTAWKCDLISYECSRTDAKASAAPADETNAVAEADPQQRRGRDQVERGNSDRSPDGRWIASVKDHNVMIRSPDDDAKDVQLSNNGKEGEAYGRFSWAPDSKTLTAFRIEPGERKEVYLIQSSPAGGGRAKLQTSPYALPGDTLTTYELNLFDVANRKQTKPDVDRFEHGWEPPRLHWSHDGRHFAYQQVDRGHQRFRVVDVDSQSGAVRNIIDEKTETFIWTAHTENLRLNLVNWLEKTDELIYVSERDGWRHLYLVDIKEGTIKNQITKGEYVVRGIDRIDEDQRQVWFNASGLNQDQDPYLIHFYRVNFDGTGLVALTGGNGNHSVQYSPDQKFLIDTFSRVDAAPVNELRRASDGKLVCRLEEADISELKADGWEAPEVFVAKGRDGKTDIWGIICRPRNFDPNKKYPVVEDIYAGPQGSFVPKTFSPTRRYASLTDVGFVVAKVDGMGTANRSKAFHDVCWKNLKDAGFADRILWHKAVAAKYPWYDLSRVGIYGNSAGGQNAAAAVLFHPEFYKAAVASCGCHDNRMDKASWNEQWMGYPVGPQYSECSNIDNANRLRGKLFLIVGEMDTNVPPESTFRFVDALVKAGKDFELLVIPGGGHGMGGAYGQRRMQDFFVHHLLGAEPPDRNGEAQQPGG